MNGLLYLWLSQMDLFLLFFIYFTFTLLVSYLCLTVLLGVSFLFLLLFVSIHLFSFLLERKANKKLYYKIL